MNFDYTPKEKAFFKSLQELMKSIYNGSAPGKNSGGEMENHLRTGLKELGKISYLALGIEPPDPDFGGLSTLTGAMEVVSGISPSLFLSVEMNARLFGRLIDMVGDGTQKARWLEPMKKGEIIGGVAVSENTMNIDNDPLQTCGERRDGSVVVNGRKQHVINGPIADWLAVVGRMGDDTAVFLIDRGRAGFDPGGLVKTGGYPNTPSSNIELKDCFIPEDQVIVPVKRKKLLTLIRFWENQILIGGCLGMMKASFERAKIYAHAHKTGGRPIVAYQEIGFKLAEMLTLVQTSRLLALRAAWTAENDEKAADAMTLCAKVFCTEAAEKVSGNALQILAGEGILAGNQTEAAFRAAKYCQIAGTSTEIARVKIGDAALGIGT
jgi:alkylation response protein AidB-like acyl-CoA dehydrogenase